MSQTAKKKGGGGGGGGGGWHGKKSFHLLVQNTNFFLSACQKDGTANENMDHVTICN